MTELPISLLQSVRVSDTTPLGYLIPQKKSDPPLLVFNWEGNPCVLRLAQPGLFNFAPIRHDYVVRGTLITDIEVIVDLESRYNASREQDPLGAIILQERTVSVMAVRAGDSFGDPTTVPLIGQPIDDVDGKVGFAKWQIVAKDGLNRIILWRSPEAGDVTK